MRSSGKCVSSGFVLLALLAIAAACGTTSVAPPDPPVPVDPPPAPPEIVVDPQPVDPPATVPLADHQKVVAKLTKARGSVKELESANAKLVTANAVLVEENKTLHTELDQAKGEADLLRKKLAAIISPPPVSSDDPEEPNSIVESYTVQSGDGFEQIAAKTEIYGNSERWRDLYEANRERLGLTKPEDLRAGMELEIKRP